jgi:ketosteroid isomerase-like protein
MANEQKALSVVQSYHRAWTTGQFDEAGRLLADDLNVEVPINNYPTKASFIDAVKQTRQMVSKVELLSELGGDREAMLLYDMTLPFGDMRIAEHFTVSGGRITRIRQIHDTVAIRAAFAAAKGSAGMSTKP